MKASEVLDNLKRRFPNEPEYHQAVSEVLGTIEEAYNEHPDELAIEAPFFGKNVQSPAQHRYRPVQRRYPFPRFRKPIDP